MVQIRYINSRGDDANINDTHIVSKKINDKLVVIYTDSEEDIASLIYALKLDGMEKHPWASPKYWASNSCKKTNNQCEGGCPGSAVCKEVSSNGYEGCGCVGDTGGGFREEWEW